MKAKRETPQETFQDVFEIGKKYTIYRMSDGMAAVFKHEITVKDTDAAGNIIYTEGRGRKRYILRIVDSYSKKPLDCAVFEGWAQPVKIDTETSKWAGNACFNFIGEPGTVREWIEQHQENPYFELTNVLAMSGEDFDNDATMVFASHYEHGRHAVIDRIVQSRGLAVFAG